VEAVLAEARSGLVEPSYQAAVRMLEQDRIREAEIVLQHMREFFPEMDRTDELSELVVRRWRQGSPLDRLREAVEETYPLLRERRFAQALQARKALLERAGQDPRALALVRSAIGDLLDAWAADLLRTHAAPPALEEFLRTAQQEALPGHPTSELLGRLHLELADVYRSRRSFERALEQYELAARSGDTEVHRLAEQARVELRKSLEAEAMDAAVLAGELDGSGFGGGLWREAAEGRGSQQIVEGELQLRIPQGAGAAVVRRETGRPVRNRGLSVGMRYRAAPSLLQRAGEALFAVSLLDARGHAFELSFDGSAYNVSLADSRGELVGGGLLRAAFGDEADHGHTVELQYDFNNGLVVVLLDGRQEARYRMELEDFRLRVSLSTEPGASAGVDLADPFCRP
jgi:tetratricopeptide (TPR) repeat protein